MARRKCWCIWSTCHTPFSSSPASSYLLCPRLIIGGQEGCKIDVSSSKSIGVNRKEMKQVNIHLLEQFVVTASTAEEVSTSHSHEYYAQQAGGLPPVCVLVGSSNATFFVLLAVLASTNCCLWQRMQPACQLQEFPHSLELQHCSQYQTTDTGSDFKRPVSCQMEWPYWSPSV